MKAYVIKNKKGKYLDSCQDFETNNICDARLFDDYKEALSFSPKGCQVLEITITKGDLEQQLSEKDKEINNLKKLRKLEVEDKKELRENRVQEVIKLEKELAEKDKEIEELRQTIIDLYNTSINLEMYSKTIRYQICEEIRKKIANIENIDLSKYMSLCEILDQIEEGKRNE